MVRMERDGEGNWTCDGEPTNLGDGIIPWDPPETSDVRTLTADTLVIKDGKGEEITLKGDFKVTRTITDHGFPVVKHGKQDEPIEVECTFTYTHQPWWKRILKRWFRGE